ASYQNAPACCRGRPCSCRCRCKHPHDRDKVPKSVLIHKAKHSWGLAMNNTLTIADIKRRGMAAIEEGLRRGPVHIVKRNKPAAVVLSEDDYQRLLGAKAPAIPQMTALQWLLAQPAA